MINVVHCEKQTLNDYFTAEVFPVLTSTRRGSDSSVFRTSRDTLSLNIGLVVHGVAGAFARDPARSSKNEPRFVRIKSANGFAAPGSCQFEIKPGSSWLRI
jgi:hypothetical protein